MMPSIDPLLDRMEHSNYNCFDFVREAWQFLTGEDIAGRVQGLLGAVAHRRARVSDLKGFTRLKVPVSPCFAMFQRYKFDPHLGIFLDGKILHLTNKGVQFMPIEVARQYYLGVKYYQ